MSGYTEAELESLMIRENAAHLCPRCHSPEMKQNDLIPVIGGGFIVERRCENCGWVG